MVFDCWKSKTYTSTSSTGQVRNSVKRSAKITDTKNEVVSSNHSGTTTE